MLDEAPFCYVCRRAPRLGPHQCKSVFPLTHEVCLRVWPVRCDRFIKMQRQLRSRENCPIYGPCNLCELSLPSNMSSNALSRRQVSFLRLCAEKIKNFLKVYTLLFFHYLPLNSFDEDFYYLSETCYLGSLSFWRMCGAEKEGRILGCLVIY